MSHEQQTITGRIITMRIGNKRSAIIDACSIIIPLTYQDLDQAIDILPFSNSPVPLARFALLKRLPE